MFQANYLVLFLEATNFFNNLLSNFTQVVKINEDFVGNISKRSASFI